KLDVSAVGSGRSGGVGSSTKAARTSPTCSGNRRSYSAHAGTSPRRRRYFSSTASANRSSSACPIPAPTATALSCINASSDLEIGRLGRRVGEVRRGRFVDEGGPDVSHVLREPSFVLGARRHLAPTAPVFQLDGQREQEQLGLSDPRADRHRTVVHQRLQRSRNWTSRPSGRGGPEGSVRRRRRPGRLPRAPGTVVRTRRTPAPRPDGAGISARRPARTGAARLVRSPRRPPPHCRASTPPAIS